MNDKERCKLVEDFANDLSVCRGGNIKVTVEPHCIHFQPTVPELGGMRYEDSIYASSQIRGASALLYYFESKGYRIVKPRGKKK